MEKLTLSRKELEAFAVKTLGVRSLALRRMSTLFLSQLLQMKMRGENRAQEMIREIRYLEDLCHGTPHAALKVRNNIGSSEAWIVFKRHNGTNYYLTLARFDEGESNINERLRDAYRFDFPFLVERRILN